VLSLNDEGDYWNSDTHVASTETTLEPDTDYQIDVKELYVISDSRAGRQTNAATLSVKFSSAADRLYRRVLYFMRLASRILGNQNRR
jgi:hypothetical protein